VQGSPQEGPECAPNPPFTLAPSGRQFASHPSIGAEPRRMLAGQRSLDPSQSTPMRERNAAEGRTACSFGARPEFFKLRRRSDAIPIKREGMVFGTWFVASLGADMESVRKALWVMESRFGGEVSLDEFFSGRGNISLPLRACVREGDRPVRDAVHARPAIERGSARACERRL
jgi:hypothetical protein